MTNFDTPEPISADVEFGVGDLRIEATDRTETTVEVRPSDPAKQADVTAAEQSRVEFANGHLLLKALGGWRQWMPHRGGGSIDVQIGVPEGSRLRVEVGVAAVHSRGRLGECLCKVGAGEIRLDETGPLNLKTGAGDITVERATGTAEIVTGTGRVRIGSIDGTAAVKNSNGDTWIGEISGTGRVSAANGSISVGRVHQGIVAKTANGDVRIGEVERGVADAQTAFGQIEVGVLDGVAAWLDLHTKFGNVHNGLDDAERPDAGTATVEVHASTSFGDIEIHRCRAPVRAPGASG
jgi:hypothetical protein